MKLLFIHDGPLFYDNHGNYYEYSYHGLLERYCYIADEITFLMRTMPLTSKTNNTLLSKEIRVVSVPNFKVPKVYFKEKLKAENIIEEEIKNTDYAILRASSCSSIAIKYVKKYNVPYIYECVGCTWDSLWNYSLLGKIMAPYSFFKARKIIKNVDYVHYVSDKFLQQRYPTNGKILACSDVVISTIDDFVIQKRMKKIDLLKNNKKIIIGTAAALDVRYKGQEFVIKAIKELVRQGYDVEYYLAGGNRKNSTFLSDLAHNYGVADRIIFCGSLDEKQMLNFYDSLDIYIQPSKTEGLPRSVIEAMSRGCPVAGTNVGGIPELIQKECLFKKGNTKDIIKTISNMLKSDLKIIAKENFTRAKTYEKEKLIEKRNQFYDSFLSENPRGNIHESKNSDKL